MSPGGHDERVPHVPLAYATFYGAFVTLQANKPSYRVVRRHVLVEM